MTEKAQLEAQANQIEAVLTQHEAPARVTGGQVAPRWVRFLVPNAPETVKIEIESLSEELVQALDTDTCRVSRQQGGIAVEIPRADPQPVRLLPPQSRLAGQGRIPFGTALLGLSDDGAPS